MKSKIKLVAQGSVETLISTVLLFILILSALSVAWATFERSQVDYAAANIGIWMPAQFSDDPNADVKEMLTHAGLFLNPSTIEISDAKIEFSDDTQIQQDNSRAQAEGAADARRTDKELKISAVVTYTYSNILTGFSPKTYTRPISKTLTAARDYQIF